MPRHCAPLLVVALVALGCTDDPNNTARPDLGSNAPPTDMGGTGCWQEATIPDVRGAGWDDADGTAGGFPDPAVSGSCDGTTFTMTSNGIPTWEFVNVTPNGLAAQNYTWYLPENPTAPTGMNGIPMGGPVAVTVTGLPIFGPTEAPMDGYRDPIIDALLDTCGGHSAPPMGAGVYHMHGAPDCIITSLGGERWGLVVGYAFDGYPILAPVICNDTSCTSTTTATSSWRLIGGSYDDMAASAWNAHEYVDGLGNLDICNGMAITDASLPFDYAYFATDTFPYYVGCYRGSRDARNGLGGQTSADFIDYANM